MSNQVEGQSVSPNDAKPFVNGSLEVDFRVLLNRVVNLFGREYGKDKKYDEQTLGGRLIEDIKAKLAQ